MTTHELARQLLTLPECPVLTVAGSCDELSEINGYRQAKAHKLGDDLGAYFVECYGELCGFCDIHQKPVEIIIL